MDDTELNNSGAGTAPESASVPDSSPSPSGADTETSSKPLSLRDELAKNFKEFSGPPKELGDKEPLKAEKPKKDKEGRLHAPDGKFAAKESDKPVEPEKAPVETAKAPDVQPAQSKPAGLPPGFSPETKAFIEALPADHPLKKDLEKRETEISNGFKKYSDDAKRYQELDQVLAPVRPIFQQSGIQSDAQAIRSLLSWEAAFRNPQTRAAAFQSLMQTYQIDPASIAQSQPSPSTGGQEIPQAAISQYIQPVAQQLQALQGTVQGLEAQRAASEIANFSKDKPHFEQVKIRMGELMLAGAAPSMDQAYQMAIWENPQIREEMIQKQLNDALEKSKAEAAAKAQQARKAAISPAVMTPAAPALNGKERAKSVRGDILKAIDEVRTGNRA